MQAYCGSCQQQVQTNVMKACERMKRLATLNVFCGAALTMILFNVAISLGTIDLESTIDGPSFSIFVLFLFLCGIRLAAVPYCFSNLMYFTHLCPNCSVDLGSYFPENFNKGTWKIVVSSVISLAATSIGSFIFLFVIKLQNDQKCPIYYLNCH